MANGLEDGHCKQDWLKVILINDQFLLSSHFSEMIVVPRKDTTSGTMKMHEAIMPVLRMVSKRLVTN